MFAVQTFEICGAFSNVRVLILSGSRFKLAPVRPHTEKFQHLHIIEGPIEPADTLAD